METVYSKTLILGLVMTTLLASCATFSPQPTPSRFLLSQGTVLLVEENPFTPLVSVSLFVRGGSAQEKIQGTAHLLEHLLFRKGHESASNYSQQIHHFGGSTSAQTGYDYTHYTQLVPKESFPVAFETLLKHLSEFQSTSELLREEKPVLLSEIQSRQDHPDLMLTDQILESILNRSAPDYSSPAGTPASMDSLTPQSLQAFFQKCYPSANWVLSVAGNVQTEEVFLLAQKLVTKSSSKKRISAPPIPKQRPDWKWKQEKSATFRLGAGVLLPAFSHPDRPALLVAERYLEWFLREYLMKDFQFKTSVDISSFYLRSAGVLAIRLAGGESSWVTQEFFRGLTEVRKHPPSPQLVETIKHFLLLQHYKKTEDFHQTAFALGEAEILGNYRYFTEFPQQLSQVSAQEVHRVLQNYLSQDNIHCILWEPNASSIKLPLFEDMSIRPDPKQKLFPPVRKKKIRGTIYPIHSNQTQLLESQHTFVLPNGLKVVLRKRPHSAVNSVGLFFKAGTAYSTEIVEGALPEGTASLLETYLEGRIYHTFTEELHRKLTQLGGDFQWKITPDLLWAEGTVLPRQTLEAIQFLRNAFQAPEKKEAVPWERIQQEQGVKWKMEAESLSQLGKYTILPLLFLQHPYGKKILLTEPQLVAIPFESLQQFYKDYFTADRGSLVVVGDFEEEAILQQIQKCFADWAQKSSTIPSLPLIEDSQNSSLVETQETAFAQSFLFLGSRVCGFGEPDHIPLLILQGILNHRLFQQLVYKKSVAYQTTALGDFYAAGGFLGMTVLISPKHETLAKIQLHDIITSLKQDEVSLSELQQVKKQLLVSQQIYYRIGRNLVQGLGTLSLLSTNPPPELQECLERVTAQQILQLSQKYFSSQQLTLLHLKGNISK
ncbi:MAG: pitrilysin family protein [Planctomycetota bacterium]